MTNSQNWRLRFATVLRGKRNEGVLRKRLLRDKFICSVVYLSYNDDDDDGDDNDNSNASSLYEPGQGL